MVAGLARLRCEIHNRSNANCDDRNGNHDQYCFTHGTVSYMTHISIADAYRTPMQVNPLGDTAGDVSTLDRAEGAL